MTARFKIGAIVQMSSSRRLDPDSYEVVRVMPQDGPELSYRLRNLRDGHERIAAEHILSSVDHLREIRAGMKPK